MSDSGNSPALTSYTMLSINLTETNRNPPEFDESFYRAKVEEQQMAPVDVIDVQAIDGDSGDNGRVTYSLDQVKNNDESRRLFGLDELNGRIQTKDLLSYRRTSVYRLVVLATDHVRFRLRYSSQGHDDDDEDDGGDDDGVNLKRTYCTDKFNILFFMVWFCFRNDCLQNVLNRGAT